MFTVVEGLEYAGGDFIREEPDVTGDGKPDAKGDLGVVEEEKEKRPITELQTQKAEVSLIRLLLLDMSHLGIKIRGVGTFNICPSDLMCFKDLYVDFHQPTAS